MVEARLVSVGEDKIVRGVAHLEVGEKTYILIGHEEAINAMVDSGRIEEFTTKLHEIIVMLADMLEGSSNCHLHEITIRISTTDTLKIVNLEDISTICE